jgi:hypothetical protein
VPRPYSTVAWCSLQGGVHVWRLAQVCMQGGLRQHVSISIVRFGLGSHYVCLTYGSVGCLWRGGSGALSLNQRFLDSYALCWTEVAAGTLGGIVVIHPPGC